MTKNTLFNFLSRQKNSPLPDVKDRVLSTNSNNNAYYRLELPVKEKLRFELGNKRLMLTDHHVSVYEYENKENPNLSQYHYTAHLNDVSGATYRLHVYFDSNNQLAKNPILENAGQDHYQNLINHSELENQFTALAIRFTYPLIEALKKQQGECIKQLETVYETSMVTLNKALFEETSLQGMLCLVNDALQWLTELMPLVHKNHLLKDHRFLKTMQKSLQDRNHPLLEAVNSLPVSPSLAEEETNQSTEAPPLLHEGHAKNPQNHKKDGYSDPLEEFERIKAVFYALENEKDVPQQVKKIEELLMLIADFNLLHEEDVVDLDCLRQLQDFRLKAFTLGDSLFKRAFISGQLDLAEQMPSFYHRITPTYLAWALHQGD